ncbi:MAG: nickel insertion protein [Coriobacteriales bacterium]
MPDIRFELEEDATRKRIFATLISSLPNDVERGKVGRIVGDNSIRMEQQLRNVEEIEQALELTVAGSFAKENTLAIYRILAAAEAKAHGCPVEEAHFHEVGKGMTVREILGICTAVELLQPEHITCSPVQVGSGTVECSHGTLDIPAPATKIILEDYGIPVAAARLEGELCTPTSAAILAHFVDSYS